MAHGAPVTDEVIRLATSNEDLRQVDIAHATGVTRQRVQQILKRAGIERRGGRTRGSANRNEVVLLATQGKTSQEIAEALDISLTAVRKHLSRAGVKAKRPPYKVTPSRYTDWDASRAATTERLRETLKRAYDELGEPLSWSSYDKWARQNGAVSAQRISQHFERFPAACAEANVPFVGKRLARSDAVGPDLCLLALRAFHADTGECSVPAYDRWRKQAEAQWPTDTTIRKWLGGWVHALKQAGIER